MSFMLIQCQPNATADPVELTADSQTVQTTEQAPDGATPPPGYENYDWADILAEAKGQTVNWHMWGGSDQINNWVTDYVVEQMKTRFDVTVNLVYLDDTADAVKQVQAEQAAGQDENGAVDLIWINGENFKTLHLLI